MEIKMLLFCRKVDGNILNHMKKRYSECFYQLGGPYSTVSKQAGKAPDVVRLTPDYCNTLYDEWKDTRTIFQTKCKI